MGYTLILSEKPKQALAYAQVFEHTERKNGYIDVKDSMFPNGAKITWGVGHLVELEPPPAYGEKYERWNLENLPLLPTVGEFKRKITERTRDQYNIVQHLLEGCSDIIVASDAGREGELIAYSILEMAKADHKPIKRLWADQMVTSKLKEAFKNLRSKEETYNYYIEAQTRQYSDWLVGMNGSPLISILINKIYKLPKFEVFSLGRVQTPSLFMIYEVDKKIENFVSTPFFELKGVTETEKGSFSVTLSTNKRFPSSDELNDFLRKEGLKIGLNDGLVKSIEIKKREQKAPSLYNLTDLQKEANKRYGMTAKKVLSILQQLYDDGFLTYPRTDSNHIGEDEFKDVLNHRDRVAKVLGIDLDWATDEPQKQYVDDSKVVEHSALMITEKVPAYENLSSDEKIIYSLVAISNLRMFCREYIYNTTKLTVGVNNVDLVASGKTDLELGWKALNRFLIASKKQEKNNEEEKLPILSEGDLAKVTLKSHQGKTEPPKRMTESRLLELMENPNVDDESDKAILKETSGIGTVATRSDIIERLKEHKYITNEKGNTLVTTEKGKILCESIAGTLLSNPSMTANWERYLQQIHTGKASQSVFLEKIHTYIIELIKTLPKKLEAKKETVIQIQEKQAEKEKIGICPNCGGNITKKLISSKKDDKTIKHVFYGCTGYDQGCKFSIPEKVSGKTLTVSNVKQILTKGITHEIKGFKPKDSSKKDFSAKLKLVDKQTGKISFQF